MSQNECSYTGSDAIITLLLYFRQWLHSGDVYNVSLLIIFCNRAVPGLATKVMPWYIQV